jgi:hypothetical protein
VVLQIALAILIVMHMGIVTQHLKYHSVQTVMIIGQDRDVAILVYMVYLTS